MFQVRLSVAGPLQGRQYNNGGFRTNAYNR